MIETIQIEHLAVQHAAPAKVTRAPVLFVHGYFADGTLWRDWLPFFANRGFPAYAVNLRGRGGSGNGVEHGGDLGHASLADFVDDARRVAHAIGATSHGKPAVIGHSMGGLISQQLAALGAVRAGVLVAPAPPRGITVLSPRLVIKQLKYLPAILGLRVVRPKRDDLRELVLNCVPPRDQDAILDALVPDSGRAGRDMSVVGFPVDRTAVKVPLFAITADQDHFIPKPIVERIAARYGAPLQTFVGHGHMLVLEPGWEAVADAAARWLESV
jgi:pimeloyl-ACP methyl ester carboxylesterase